MIKYLFFLFLFLTGCASTLPTTQRISLTESSNLSPKITRITDRIKKHFKLMKFNQALSDPMEKRKVLIQAGGTRSPELGFCECSRRTNSCTIGFSPSIETESDLFIEVVILHEIGHAFGLKHSEDRSSIMFKNRDRHQKISINEVYRFIQTLKRLE